MKNKIRSITLNDTILNNYHLCDESKSINNLSRVNIFIGPNNSGKSRFIRELYKLEKMTFIPGDTDISFLSSAIKSFSDELNNAFSGAIREYGAVKSKLPLKEFTVLEEGQDIVAEVFGLVNLIKDFHGNETYSSVSGYIDKEGFLYRLKEIADRAQKTLSDFNSPLIYKFKKVYIPTLRGLRPVVNGEDNYANRTNKDYFNKAVNIFTGLTLYNDVKNSLLGKLSQRKMIADYQEYLSKTFFEDKPVVLIPSINSDVLNIKIGDEQEYPIYDLGDGIQSIIVMTFPLFLYRGENLLLFIEEPELFLHPGLQRKLIETFLNENNLNLQLFVTTHSNHFLDATLDYEQISLYTFQKRLEEKEGNEKVAHFNVDNVTNEDDRVLELIGVKTSSVFLSNCTLWVEGITDRLYIRHYLKLYQEHDVSLNKYKEDIHYSFIEYSGNNIAHWSFLDENERNNESINVNKICRKLLLIADRDGDKKLKRSKRLKEKLGKDYCQLECNEIENLVSSQVLCRVVAEYEKKSVNELKWVHKVRYSGYQLKALGKYIDKNLSERTRKSQYADDSGTISDKLGFCRKVISQTQHYEDMSELAIKLCDKIFSFVKKHND
jgi:hypothetical protein